MTDLIETAPKMDLAIQDIAHLVEEAGFDMERLETGYMEGPRPMTFMYEGTARPR